MIICALVGAAVYTTGEVFSFLQTGEWSWNWYAFAGSIMGGMLGGAAGVTFNWAVGSVVGGASSTFFSMSMEKVKNVKNYSWKDIAIQTFESGLISLSSYVILKGMDGFFISKQQSFSSQLIKDRNISNRLVVQKATIYGLVKMYAKNYYDNFFEYVFGKIIKGE